MPNPRMQDIKRAWSLSTLLAPAIVRHTSDEEDEILRKKTASLHTQLLAVRDPSQRQAAENLKEACKFLAEQDKATGEYGYQRVMKTLPASSKNDFLYILAEMNGSMELGIQFQERSARDREAEAREEAARENLEREKQERTARENKAREMGNPTVMKMIEEEQARLKDSIKEGASPASLAGQFASILSARAAAGAVRGKKGSLDKVPDPKTYEEGRRNLLNNRHFKDFMKKCGEDPALAEKTRKAVLSGHGGALEDLFKKHLRELPPGQLSNDPELAHFMPTAKERIESLQKQIKALPKDYDIIDTPKEERDVRVAAAAEILRLRAMVKAEFGNKASLNKPIPVQSAYPPVSSLTADVVKLSRAEGIGPNFELPQVQKLLVKGHGGKMAERFRDAANLKWNADHDTLGMVNENTINAGTEQCKQEADYLLKVFKFSKDTNQNYLDKAKDIVLKYALLCGSAENKEKNIHRDIPWTEIEKAGADKNNMVVQALNNSRFDKDLAVKLLTNMNEKSMEAFVDSVIVETGKQKQAGVQQRPEERSVKERSVKDPVQQEPGLQ